jgi:hypothetical protein
MAGARAVAKMAIAAKSVAAGIKAVPIAVPVSVAGEAATAQK